MSYLFLKLDKSTKITKKDFNYSKFLKKPSFFLEKNEFSFAEPGKNHQKTKNTQNYLQKKKKL